MKFHIPPEVQRQLDEYAQVLGTERVEKAMLRFFRQLEAEDAILADENLTSPPDEDIEVALAARQRESLLACLEEIARLPVNNPDDGFSGRDHDKILYGKDS